MDQEIKTMEKKIEVSTTLSTPTDPLRKKAKINTKIRNNPLAGVGKAARRAGGLRAQNSVLVFINRPAPVAPRQAWHAFKKASHSRSSSKNAACSAKQRKALHIPRRARARRENCARAPCPPPGKRKTFHVACRHHRLQQQKVGKRSLVYAV